MEDTLLRNFVYWQLRFPGELGLREWKEYVFALEFIKPARNANTQRLLFEKERHCLDPYVID